MTRAQWAIDEAWDTRLEKVSSWTVTVRRQWVNSQEFRRVTVRDNETGQEIERDYLPNLTTTDECAADAFTLAMGEGQVGPVTTCPNCGLQPAYRRVLADPWDHHEVCIDCGHCYSHNRGGELSAHLYAELAMAHSPNLGKRSPA